MTNKQNEASAELKAPPIAGRWHRRNGVLTCGTLRMAVADIDGLLSTAAQNEILDWMCDQLNAAVKQYDRAKAEAASKQTLCEECGTIHAPMENILCNR